LASASAPPAAGSIASPIAVPSDFEFHGTALDLWWRYWVSLLALLAGMAAPCLVAWLFTTPATTAWATGHRFVFWPAATFVVLAVVSPYAFVIVWFLKWFTHNISYRGERLEFRGSGLGLLGWMALVPPFLLITLGFGGMLLPYLFCRWCVTRTYLRNERYVFKGDFPEWFGVTTIYLSFLPMVSLLLLFPWGVKRFTMWICKNTYVGRRQLQFSGKALPLLGWLVLYVIATPAHVLTLGFTACLIIVQMLKWYARGLRFREGASAEDVGLVPEYAAPAEPMPADLGVAEDQLPIRRAQVREAISDAESNQDWNLLADLCDRYRALAPDDAHIVEKLKSARRNRDGALRWREAQEASTRQEWRAAEKALAKHLDLFPDNKKTQDVHQQTVAQIERLAGAARARILEPLGRRQPAEALAAAKSLPLWLSEETPVVQAVQAAADLESADSLLRKGRWASAAALLGRWAETTECPWIAEWWQRAKDQLAALRRSYRKRTIILAVVLGLIGLTLAGLARYVFLEEISFIVGLGLVGAAPVVFGVGWLLASVVRSPRWGGPFQSFQEAGAKEE